ncbi:MAG: type 1 glutamine amidotransferase [Streptosporangiaceae bacterium]|jgi:GMP synthase (glutamine-hydrolysing)
MDFVTSQTERDNSRPLLIVRHVPWEGPHHIVDSFAGTTVTMLDLLDDQSAVLPPPESVRGAVLMGGPMSATDVAGFPGLQQELVWISEAIDRQVPLLGICLGAQLIAKAAGSIITRAPRSEIGVAPIQILTSDDPLTAALAPSTPALHWHSEEFTLPSDAVHLAKSEQTDIQAFRLGRSAWGLLFHLEVDAALLNAWLAEPVMMAEASAALGTDYAAQLRRDVTKLDLRRARRVFDAFAAHCATQARQLPLTS